MAGNSAVNWEMDEFAARIGALSSPPPIYHQLREELNYPNPSVNRISDIISKDPSLSSKLLQVVNTAYVGLFKTVGTVKEAIDHLGMEPVANIVLGAEIFSILEPKEFSSPFVASLWRHSIYCSALALRIAEMEGLPCSLVIESSTAAFLHDIGKLAMAKENPARYQEALSWADEDIIPHYQAENRVFGFDHAKLGGVLLSEWNLPDSIREAVAFHHAPRSTSELSLNPLAILHVTNYLEHRRMNEAVEPAIVELDLDYIRNIGVNTKLEVWQEVITTQNPY